MQTKTLTALSIMEERGHIWEKMEALKIKADGNARGLTSSERRDFMRLSKQYETLSEELKVQEALEGKEAETAEAMATTKNPERLYRAMGNAYMQAVATDQGRDHELRGLTTSTVAGAIQDPTTQREIIQLLNKYNAMPALGASMESVAAPINNYRFPKVTARMAVSWTTEGQSLSADTTYAWSYVDVDFFTMRTLPVQISWELLDSDLIGLERQIGEDVIMAFSDEITRRVFDGNGTDHPTGILNTSGILTVPASGTSLPAIGTLDVLVDAVEGLLNRNVPFEKIGIVGSHEFMAQVQKTLDTTNQPLQFPDWIRRINERGMMQSTTGLVNTFGAGTEIRAIVGDFSNVMIRTKQVVKFLRERYAETGQDGVVGYARVAWGFKRPDFAVITGLVEQTTT